MDTNKVSNLFRYLILGFLNAIFASSVSEFYCSSCQNIIPFDWNVLYYAKYIWLVFEDFVNCPVEHVACWCYSKGKAGESVHTKWTCKCGII